MKRVCGFTLIEVVVAMAILGIGLTIIIELSSGGLRLARTSMEYTKAVNYARMKMEEIAVKKNLEEGSEEGELDHTYRWKMDIKRADLLPIENETDSKAPAEVFHVKIDILWKSGSKEKSNHIESYKMMRLEDVEKRL
jgi:general secretion pathway protein I